MIAVEPVRADAAQTDAERMFFLLLPFCEAAEKAGISHSGILAGLREVTEWLDDETPIPFLVRSKEDQPQPRPAPGPVAINNSRRGGRRR